MTTLPKVSSLRDSLTTPPNIALTTSPCFVVISSCALLFISLALPTGKGKEYSLSFNRSEEHTSELQSRQYLVCRLLLEKKRHQFRFLWHAPDDCEELRARR